MTVSDRVKTLAEALDKMTGIEGDLLIASVMSVEGCASLEAEAALLITYLNDLGYDVTEMEKP